MTHTPLIKFMTNSTLETSTLPLGVFINTLSLTPSDLLRLNHGSLYAIRCPLTMRVYVSYGICVMKSIIRILDNLDSTDYGLLKHDIDKCVIDLIPADVSVRKSSMFLVGKMIKYYETQGYSLYRPTVIVSYHLKSKIKGSYAFGQYSAYFMLYVVDSRNHNPILVGKFDSKVDMDTFIELSYPGGSVTNIIYHKSTSGKRESRYVPVHKEQREL